MILTEQRIDDLEIIIIIEDMQIAQRRFECYSFSRGVRHHQIENGKRITKCAISFL